MKKRLPFSTTLAFFSFAALAVGAPACGSSDDTPGQPGNSTADSGADVAPPGAPTGDAATTDVAAPDASGLGALRDAAPEAAVPTPDAGRETSVGAPEPTLEGGPADASPDAPLGLDLDACSLPDGGIPDASLDDAGATTTSCLACIDASCATQAATCNGDCVCAGDVVALFVCTASGQSAPACLASTSTSSAFSALAFCAGLSCGAPCGLR
jgi:hypothetical protein